jgi:hypothetical protein
MRPLSRFMLAMSLMVPFASQAAQQWSSCVTLTGVSNYIAISNDNLIILATSPNIAGCAYNGIQGAIGIAAGQLGVTVTNLNTFLASALTAYSSGHQVQIYYDTTTCYGGIISNGGYAGNCP